MGWSLVSRSSSSQQLTWFPFTELVVITHTSELDRLSWASSQPLLSQVLCKASEKVAAIIRRINLAFFSSLPLLSSLLVCRAIGFTSIAGFLLPRVQRMVSGEIGSGPGWSTGKRICARNPYFGQEVVFCLKELLLILQIHFVRAYK